MLGCWVWGVFLKDGIENHDFDPISRGNALKELVVNPFVCSFITLGSFQILQPVPREVGSMLSEIIQVLRSTAGCVEEGEPSWRLCWGEDGHSPCSSWADGPCMRL